MKRIAFLVLAFAFVFLCACGAAGPAMNLGESDLYSEKEIRAAVNVVIDRFEDSKDLTLLRVKYDESYTLREMKYRKEHYGEETVIVLLTDIYVNLDAMAVGPFYPGQTSKDYQFVLTQDKLGRWNIQDSGYA